MMNNPSPPDGGAPLRVLLVEDDPVTAKTMQRMMTHGCGAISFWADSAEAGMRALARGEWDLVLVDVGLPGADGIEFLRASRARHPQTTHIITSGRSEGATVIAAMREGADDYLVKPVRADVLLTALRRIGDRGRRTAREPERVLAIGAHPDDVEIGVGGILLRHSQDGDAVHILTLTRGQRGGDVLERARESKRAAEILGATLSFGGHTDTKLTEVEALASIERIVRELHPTVVYTHTNSDTHQDHRTTYAATLVAARGVPRIYSYQAPSTLPDFRPTRFVEVADTFDGKLAAIRAHVTQANRAYLKEELLRATALYWGRFAGGGLVEALEVARESQTTQHDVAKRLGSAVGA